MVTTPPGDGYFITKTGAILKLAGDDWTQADAITRLQCLVDVSAIAPATRASALNELLDAGWTRYRVGKELGILPQRVTRWARHLGVKGQHQ